MQIESSPVTTGSGFSFCVPISTLLSSLSFLGSSLFVPEYFGSDTVRVLDGTLTPAIIFPSTFK